MQTIKDRFLEVENSILYSEATVFSTNLTEAGEKETPKIRWKLFEQKHATHA